MVKVFLINYLNKIVENLVTNWRVYFATHGNDLTIHIILGELVESLKLPESKNKHAMGVLLLKVKKYKKIYGA